MKTNINFIKYRIGALILSFLLIIFAFWSVFGPKINAGFLTPRGFNLGIDFQGGIVHQVHIYSGMSQEKMRALALSSNMGNEVQNILTNEDNRIGNSTNYLIKTIISQDEQKTIESDPDMTSSKFLEERIIKFHSQLMENSQKEYVLEGEELAKALKIYGNDYIPGEITEKREDGKRYVQNVVKISQNVISPVYSQALRLQSLFLVLFVFLIMLVYITIRFKLQYALGAIAALFHDTIIMLGFISIWKLELDMTLIAAILTLIGYSVNDTIVIFDRIRENFGIMKESSSNTIFNTSINQSLGRTIITSVTTLLAVIALFVFAGEKLRAFSLVLMVGIIVGTYSSIFIASPVVGYWDKYFGKRKIKEKKIDDKKEEKERQKNNDDNEDSQIEDDDIQKKISDGKISLSKKQIKKLSGSKKK